MPCRPGRYLAALTVSALLAGSAAAPVTDCPPGHRWEPEASHCVPGCQRPSDDDSDSSEQSRLEWAAYDSCCRDSPASCKADHPADTETAPVLPAPALTTPESPSPALDPFGNRVGGGGVVTAAASNSSLSDSPTLSNAFFQPAVYAICSVIGAILIAGLLLLIHRERVKHYFRRARNLVADRRNPQEQHPMLPRTSEQTRLSARHLPAVPGDHPADVPADPGNHPADVPADPGNHPADVPADPGNHPADVPADPGNHPADVPADPGDHPGDVPADPGDHPADVPANPGDHPADVPADPSDYLADVPDDLGDHLLDVHADPDHHLVDIPDVPDHHLVDVPALEPVVPNSSNHRADQVIYLVLDDEWHQQEPVYESAGSGPVR